MRYSQVFDGSGKFEIDEVEPRQDGGLEREEGEAKTEKLGKELAELLEWLTAARRHPLLILFQGRDTSGKDGAIRKILDFSNAQTLFVHPFGVPTEEELAHDFLWRIHQRTPGRGRIAIFNRSHYEDVLVVRVRELVPPEVWRPRYDRINEFETLLREHGTILVKFFLHISKEEQEERLLAREQEALKAWKLSVQDWRERELWDDYSRAYEDMVNRCAAAEAPWHVIPADRKWYRNLAVMECLVDTLKPYREEWREALEKMGEAAKKELADYRAGKAGA